MRPLASEFVQRKDGVESWKDPGKYKAAAIWRVIRPKKGESGQAQVGMVFLCRNTALSLGWQY